jgi:hypothetical protein
MSPDGDLGKLRRQLTGHLKRVIIGPVVDDQNTEAIGQLSGQLQQLKDV